MDPAEILHRARSILLIDWPSREVPDTLARVGLEVVSADGPETYDAYELHGGGIRVRRVDGPPERVDLVYAFRPTDELPEIVEQARALGAGAVWLEGVAPDDAGRAREIVESAGMAFVTSPPIAEAARSVGTPG